jgi:hypothetical protein
VRAILLYSPAMTVQQCFKCGTPITGSSGGAMRCSSCLAIYSTSSTTGDTSLEGGLTLNQALEMMMDHKP